MTGRFNKHTHTLITRGPTSTEYYGNRGRRTRSGGWFSLFFRGSSWETKPKTQTPNRASVMPGHIKPRDTKSNSAWGGFSVIIEGLDDWRPLKNIFKLRREIPLPYFYEKQQQSTVVHTVSSSQSIEAPLRSIDRRRGMGNTCIRCKNLVNPKSITQLYGRDENAGETPCRCDARHFVPMEYVGTWSR